MCGRAEAQVRRIACIYALLDQSATVGKVHLEAALALWNYAESSVRYIFGESLGNPLADDILLALREAPQGLTRDEMHRTVFKGHKGSADIARALKLLHSLKLAEPLPKQTTGGRPAERWVAIPTPEQKAS
jgi:hypothetical protein